MDFAVLLAAYAARVAHAVSLLDAFLSGSDVAHLRSAADVLVELGSETFAALALYGQAVLAALSLDAGLRLREKALEIEERGLRTSDVEYVADVRDLLRRVADSIERGEYERSYYEMLSRRGGR